ncbi:ribonuclease P protein component [Simplicispira hankyongi]|uniref:Ribonuclease P protein component n=1 Tax=Simplicispira hankyongi TaxID=2315688 RepID=A0A398CAM8_9BURK|nr:ribonuclease P protein component [Simplicispira hankyongi]RID97938.1 ribonuclease P protein component [Simplicispira hankyongi]
MQRLKTRPQFQATLDGGTVARTPHFAMHRLVLAPTAVPLTPVDGGVVAKPLIVPGMVWLGAMVPKRWARRAVTRNAIKRQIFSVATSFEPQLPLAAHVVRLRAAFDRKVFVSASSDVLKSAVREELHTLFERASRSSA